MGIILPKEAWVLFMAVGSCVTGFAVNSFYFYFNFFCIPFFLFIFFYLVKLNKRSTFLDIGFDVTSCHGANKLIVGSL